LFKEDNFKENKKEILYLVSKGSYFNNKLPNTAPGRFTIDNKGNLYILEFVDMFIAKLPANTIITENYKQQIKVYNNGIFIKNITLDKFANYLISGIAYIDGFIILVPAEDNKIFFFDPQIEKIQLFYFSIPDGTKKMSVSKNCFTILTKKSLLRIYEFQTNKKEVNLIGEINLFNQYFKENIEYFVIYSYDERLIVITEISDYPKKLVLYIS
jgi:hypothetical protein